jgi:hypothetical protein
MSSLGRNPMISKTINYSALAIAGFLMLANIHYSAVGIGVVARMAATADFTPVAARGGMEGLLARYGSAFATDMLCLIISGIAFHPQGLPLAFGEIKRISGDGAVSRGLGTAVTVLIVLALGYGGFNAYAYNLSTSMLAFGVSSLWAISAFPVWLNVVGPEVFFHGTHLYGRLLSGSGATMASNSNGNYSLKP